MSKEQVTAAIAIARVIANAIKELGQIPNGHLYAQVMGSIGYENYMACIAMLKRSGVIREENNLLIWNLPIDG